MKQRKLDKGMENCDSFSFAFLLVGQDKIFVLYFQKDTCERIYRMMQNVKNFSIKCGS